MNRDALIRLVKLIRANEQNRQPDGIIIQELDRFISQIKSEIKSEIKNELKTL